MFERKVQEMFYRRAQKPEDLPWHSEQPAGLLVDVVARRNKPARALDVGCGAGVFSIYLARHGYDVTGLDFMPKAVEMARERAKGERVAVNWVLADALEWKGDAPFDLVLDSGCLHTFPSGTMPQYKRQLLDWLAADGDFVLAHWGKKRLTDWRPVGPRRRSRQKLVRFFSPELEEHAYKHELLAGIPLPIGPSVLGQCFWFRRNGRRR